MQTEILHDGCMCEHEWLCVDEVPVKMIENEQGWRLMQQPGESEDQLIERWNAGPHGIDAKPTK